MGAGRPRRRRSEEGEEVSDALYSGVKPGAICSTDIQVAINSGNRREDVFFTTRVGKAGTSGPFQQPIPQDFARYHLDRNREDVVLENASGEKWVVTIRPSANFVRFGKGWRAFSLENNLRDGHQLILTQVGKRHFKVTVYDCHGKSVLGQPPNDRSEASPPLKAIPKKSTLHDILTPSEHPREAASPPETRGKALAEPAPNVAEPASSLTARPSQPARTDYPMTRPAVLDSNMAKLILRHILPPPPPCQFPDPHITAALTELPVPIQVPPVDRTRVVAPTEEQNEMEVAEGKDYIFLDSDEDDEFVLLEVAMETSSPKSGPKIVAKTATVVGMNSCTGEGEQSGVRIHSPSEKQEVSTPEIDEPDDTYSVSESDDSEEDDDDDLPLTRLPRRGSGARMIRRKYESASRNKICVRRPSWKGERMNHGPPQSPSSTSASFPTRRSKHYEVGESSKRPLVEAQEEDDDDGEAVRLVRQQGRKNFSNIVCTHRQHHVVSSKDKKRALDAAMEFSSELVNDKFMAIMYPAQVYHGFHLPVPVEILEATGTLGAKVVEARLIDKHRKTYVVNWAWHDFCETPLLNKDGWAKFALDHFLKEGDVCVFELMNSTSAPTSGLYFHVHIFHVHVEEAHLDDYRTPLANTFPAYQSGTNSAPAESWEVRHKEEERKWPPLSGDFRLQCRPSWTKLIKPARVHGHFGGSRGQRRF